MEVDRKFILNTSKATGFQPDIIEKAYRLILLLKEINSHPTLSKELLLKGGTAINFVYLSLPRLSIDLDFNFIGGPTKEEKDLRREDIKRYLEAIFTFLKYQIRERSEYGIHQFFLSYTNSALNTDVIKLEVNYLMRVSLLPDEKKRVRLPFFKNLDFSTKTLSLEENYGGKIKALITRGAARDLFDVYSLLNEGVKFKKPLLKKVSIFFGCLDRSDFRKFSPNSINNITEREIKTDLLPLLRKGIAPSRAKMIKNIKPFLEDMLTLSRQEKEYVNSFFKGEYSPELLFTGKEVADLDSLMKHPMALWKQQHIKNWLQGQQKK